MKQVKTFRPEVWFAEGIKTYATQHQMVQPDGSFNYTDALHGWVRELKELSTAADAARKEAATWKNYALTLQKEAKTFRCVPLNQPDNTVQDCVQCINHARTSPASQIPESVRNCPRIVTGSVNTQPQGSA